MKWLFDSDVSSALAILILVVTIQGCRYANLKIDQLEAKIEQKEAR